LAKTLRSRGHRALLAVLVASRREAGLTQADLAKRLGVVPSWVAKVEIGERRLDLVEFVALSRALKLDPAVLFERFMAWEKAGKGRATE
jgi:transcriptional regulator with XRE-family HTH domain